MRHRRISYGGRRVQRFSSMHAQNLEKGPKVQRRANERHRGGYGTMSRPRWRLEDAEGTLSHGMPVLAMRGSASFAVRAGAAQGVILPKGI